ncbi:MAG: CopG family transcriptional regulator [Spirochaetales bacterium]|nr:CopG family transcriptional regulator [Spirochaetales bacterium]
MSEIKKQEVITFKVSGSVAKILKSIPNRSEFIRSAVLNALENSCPLCKGMGTFTPAQLEHWKKFSRRHSLEECQDCHSLHLVCEHESKQPSFHSEDEKHE